MNLRTIVFSLALPFLLVGCSDQLRIHSDYDKDVRLVNYKTYNWLPAKEIESKNDPLLLNELTFKRIHKAIDTEMAIKHIQYTESVPALLVHFHLILDNKTAIRPAFYGYNYGAYWTRTQVDMYQYREGTLIIDLMDATNKNLLWRGWGTAIMDDETIEITEEQISIKNFKSLPALYKIT
jgi:hypothetical protein